MERPNQVIQENIQNKIKNKTTLDKIVKVAFTLIGLLCASVIVVVVIFILIRGLQPFINTYTIDGVEYRVDFWKFLFGNTYFTYPNIYGVGYIIINTIYITLLSLVIAVPVSVLSALFIVRIAPKKVGKVLNAVIELLASVPSVIYGVFGAGVITTIVKTISSWFNYQSAGGVSTLSTVLVLAIMIIPTITMISCTSIKACKEDYIKGSLALGASNTYTNFHVVLTSAKSGIFSGIILGVGRALGEATAVSMVAGNAGNGPTFNLFDITKTLTSTMLQGFSETSGLDYDIKFSVGIVLMVVILVTNLLLNLLKKKIGGSYDK